MAYTCPRCRGPVQRGSSAGAAALGGAVGALLAMAFGGFNCPKCGEIPKSEFPPDVRSKMTMGSIVMVFSALALLGAVILLLAFLYA